MTWPRAYRRAVASDVADAYTWYESQRPGLGEEFLQASDAALARLAEQPDAYEVVEQSREVRRALTRRFPYAVYFFKEPERIVVLAILHTARDPAVWMQRP